MKYIKCILAYTSIIILWIYIFSIVLSIFDIIEFDRGGVVGTTIIAFVFGSIYHKYKPMEIKELFKLILKKLEKSGSDPI